MVFVVTKFKKWFGKCLSLHFENRPSPPSLYWPQNNRLAMRLECMKCIECMDVWIYCFVASQTNAGRSIVEVHTNINSYLHWCMSLQQKYKFCYQMFLINNNCCCFWLLLFFTLAMHHKRHCLILHGPLRLWNYACACPWWFYAILERFNIASYPMQMSSNKKC